MTKLKKIIITILSVTTSNISTTEAMLPGAQSAEAQFLPRKAESILIEAARAGVPSVAAGHINDIDVEEILRAFDVICSNTVTENHIAIVLLIDTKLKELSSKDDTHQRALDAFLQKRNDELRRQISLGDQETINYWLRMGADRSLVPAA